MDAFNFAGQIAHAMAIRKINRKTTIYDLNNTNIIDFSLTYQHNQVRIRSKEVY
jgi:hypothetical protein